MKRILLSALLALPMVANGAKFCEVTITGKPFSRKEEIYIDYGDSVSVVKFTNVPKALNYLSENGWVFISSSPAITSGSGVAIMKIYLKKED